MSTRCDLYIEEDLEKYIGVQCTHFGHPEHMIREISFCGYRLLHDYIIIGGSRGGIKIFNPSKGETQFLFGAPFYLYDPWSFKTDADYIYVFDKDQKINWKDNSKQNVWQQNSIII